MKANSVENVSQVHEFIPEFNQLFKTRHAMNIECGWTTTYINFYFPKSTQAGPPVLNHEKRIPSTGKRILSTENTVFGCLHLSPSPSIHTHRDIAIPSSCYPSLSSLCVTLGGVACTQLFPMTILFFSLVGKLHFQG